MTKSDLKSVVLGTRKSKLAMIQTHTVLEGLSPAFPNIDFPIHTIMVRGDADKNTPFLLMTEKNRGSDLAKSLWTEEMEARLLDGSLDILVHSLKDLATTVCDGTSIGAYLPREDPRDALVMRSGLRYTSLQQLPTGSRVGTSSIRRKALLHRLYPDLVVEECRGNVDTRLAKLDDANNGLSCVILASAGLHRMGLEHRITQYMPAKTWPYAVGQGAIGLQIRAGDIPVADIAQALDEHETRLQCVAERSLLRRLQGGCSSPVGVYSYMYKMRVYDNDSHLKKDTTVMRLGGSVIHPHGWSEVTCSEKADVTNEREAGALGVMVAEELLRAGAADILSRMHKIQAAGISKHFEQTDELEAIRSTLKA